MGIPRLEKLDRSKPRNITLPVDLIQMLHVILPAFELIELNAPPQHADGGRPLREVTMLRVVQRRAYEISNEDRLVADDASGEVGTKRRS